MPQEKKIIIFYIFQLVQFLEVLSALCSVVNLTAISLERQVKVILDHWPLSKSHSTTPPLQKKIWKKLYYNLFNQRA